MTSSAAATSQRILAHFRGVSSSMKTSLGDFTRCVVDVLNGDREDEDFVRVKCTLEDDRVVLEKAGDKEDDPNVGVMRHPPFCPIRLLKHDSEVEVEAEMASRGINVGVVALVESSDNRVLVTRRASHMRTFPGVWVPPGGGLDAHDASMQHAAARELTEETGVTIPDPAHGRILCLWESVYPPMLDWGAPRRHHVVVYYHFTLDKKHDEVKLILEPEEVDAASWLCASHADLVVNGVEEGQEVKPETFNMTVLVDKEQKDVECSAEILLAKAPKKRIESGDVERISSGTKYALSEWLKIKTDCCNNKTARL